MLCWKSHQFRRFSYGSANNAAILTHAFKILNTKWTYIFFLRSPISILVIKQKQSPLTWFNIPMQKPSIVYRKIHPVSWATTTIVLSFFSKEHNAVMTSSLGAIHVWAQGGDWSRVSNTGELPGVDS